MGIFDFCCAKCGDSESGQERYGQSVIFKAFKKDGSTMQLSGTYNGYGAIELGDLVFQDKGCHTEYGLDYSEDEHSDFVCDEIYCEDCLDGLATDFLKRSDTADFLTVQEMLDAEQISPIYPDPTDLEDLTKEQLITLCRGLMADLKIKKLTFSQI